MNKSEKEIYKHFAGEQRSSHSDVAPHDQGAKRSGLARLFGCVKNALAAHWRVVKLHNELTKLERDIWKNPLLYYGLQVQPCPCPETAEHLMTLQRELKAAIEQSPLDRIQQRHDRAVQRANQKVKQVFRGVL